LYQRGGFSYNSNLHLRHESLPLSLKWATARRRCVR
jgi:hypothetical protein